MYTAKKFTSCKLVLSGIMASFIVGLSPLTAAAQVPPAISDGPVEDCLLNVPASTAESMIAGEFENPGTIAMTGAVGSSGSAEQTAPLPADFVDSTIKEETSSSETPAFEAGPLYPEGSLLAQRLPYEPTAQSDLDTISKSILLKEIELLKLNTRYRAESTRVSKWKPWRQAAYGLAANVVLDVGISHIAFARWKYWQRPNLATKPFLRKGPICLLIGHSILAGGVFIESGLDFINDRKTRRNGFDRKTCRQRVMTLRNDIDKLMADRDGAISQAGMTEPQRELYEAESKVLKDIRNCALDEYARLAARAAKWKTARNTANAMILTNAATGGYIGSLGNLLAVMNRKPRLALPAGIGFITSGATIVLTAPATRFVSGFIGKREGKKERQALGGVATTAPADFDKSRAALAAIVNSGGGGVNEDLRNRLEIYSMKNEALDSLSVLAKNEAKASDKEFVEKLIVGAATGGTKIAWGVNLAVAGSAWSNTAPRQVRNVPIRINGRIFRVTPRPPKTPAQMFSRRLAQGATCQVVGASLGALDVLQSRVRGEIRAHNAVKAGKAPGQILASRMKKLEEMEKKLGM